MHYDYLVVGAGASGATFARQLTDAGKKVQVIDRRPYVAGNIYTVVKFLSNKTWSFGDSILFE